MNARNGFVPYVEGLRGVAAMYVFLYHIWVQFILVTSPLVGMGIVAGALFGYGHYSVAIFIVISGFCLGLPVVRKTRPFAVPDFARRRFRRLFPAYAAALLLSLPPFYFFARVQLHHTPPLSHVAIGLLTHVLMVNNLSPSTMLYINGPMWSIAVEVQIYIVFALLLVPLWRRYGANVMALTGIGLSLLPTFLLHGRFAFTCPWMLGLFAMGFWAADASERTPARPFPWKTVALAAGAIAIAIGIAVPREGAGNLAPSYNAGFLVPDLAIGVAVAAFFVASSRGSWFISRFFALRPFERVGSFSYSLYLIHAPFVTLTVALLLLTHASAVVWMIAWPALIPIVLVSAYGLYVLFERPFMSPARVRADDALSAPPLVKSVAAARPALGHER